MRITPPGYVHAHLSISSSPRLSLRCLPDPTQPTLLFLSVSPPLSPSHVTHARPPFYWEAGGRDPETAVGGANSELGSDVRAPCSVLTSLLQARPRSRTECGTASARSNFETERSKTRIRAPHARLAAPPVSQPEDVRKASPTYHFPC